jgi:hypothetical protein
MLSDGTYILTVFQDYAVTLLNRNTGVYLVRGRWDAAAGLIAWDLPEAVIDYDATYNRACSAKLLELPDGTWLVAYYEYARAIGSSDYKPWVARSLDRGQSWTYIQISLLVGNETVLESLGGNNVRAWIRSTGSLEYADSSDGGLTWGSRTAMNPTAWAASRPNIQRLPSGEYFLLYRASIGSPNEVTAYVTSQGGRTSWKDPVQLERAVFQYASFLPTASGVEGVYCHSTDESFNLLLKEPGPCKYFSYVEGAAVEDDVDAQSFVSRSGITDWVQKSAVYQLVFDLKTAGVWDKLLVAYPFVGGSPATHAVNLVSSSFGITWQGTNTHDASGVKSNGTTGYGQTGFSCSAEIASINSALFHIYTEVDPSTGRYWFGVQGNRVGIYYGAANKGGLSGLFNAAFLSSGADFTGGNLVAHRVSATSNRLYSDLGPGPEKTEPVVAMPSDELYLLGTNNGGSILVTTLTNSYLKWFAAGEGFSDADRNALMLAVSRYQNNLGRAA